MPCARKRRRGWSWRRQDTQQSREWRGGGRTPARLDGPAFIRARTVDAGGPRARRSPLPQWPRWRMRCRGPRSPWQTKQQPAGDGRAPLPFVLSSIERRRRGDASVRAEAEVPKPPPSWEMGTALWPSTSRFPRAGRGRKSARCARQHRSARYQRLTGRRARSRLAEPGSCEGR